MQSFSLRITALVFPFLFSPRWCGERRSDGVEPGKMDTGGGGRGSTVGWTALSLSPGSAWHSAELTEPILSGCHCNINTHLEQMRLKAWNIEQTAATDPVPLQEHLWSIDAAFPGRKGSPAPLSTVTPAAHLVLPPPTHQEYLPLDLFPQRNGNFFLF